jgi:flagellar motor switch protein FliM
MSEPLSPSEVQSLFAGLNLAGGATETTGGSNSASDQTWAGDQFTLPMALDGNELATLQAWQEAFSQEWSRTWTEPFASRFAIQNGTVRVIRLRDFVSAHGDWQGFQVISMRHDCPLWVTLDATLVAAYVDCLLGGQEPAGPLPRRTPGPLEQQLTARLVRSVCDALFGSTPATDWQIRAVNSTTDWIAGIPVYLACEIVQWDFELRSSETSGHLSLAIPRSACSTLSSSHANTRSSPASATATLKLRATLPTISLSSTELQELQVGDVLLTSQGDQAACLVSWDGQQRFTASIGAHQGHKAIRLAAATD